MLPAASGPFAAGDQHDHPALAKPYREPLALAMATFGGHAMVGIRGSRPAVQAVNAISENDFINAQISR